MSRTLPCPAVVIVAVALVAGCDLSSRRDEEHPPPGLRLQPPPGSTLEQGDTLELPPVAPRDPLLEPTRP